MSELGILRVENLHFYRGYGFYPEESALLTQFVVNIAVGVKHQTPPITLSSIVNYETIVTVVNQVFTKEWQFIESIADEIHRSISQLEGVVNAWVKVDKIKPATLSCQQTSYELGSI